MRKALRKSPDVCELGMGPEIIDELKRRFRKLQFDRGLYSLVEEINSFLQISIHFFDYVL